MSNLSAYSSNCAAARLAVVRFSLRQHTHLSRFIEHQGAFPIDLAANGCRADSARHVVAAGMALMESVS